MCTCCYQEFIDLIDDMLLDERYNFAEDTLSSIRDWVSDNEFITDNQITAIKNIENSGKSDNFRDEHI